jgi:hypothetical protein
MINWIEVTDICKDIFERLHSSQVIKWETQSGSAHSIPERFEITYKVFEEKLFKLRLDRHMKPNGMHILVTLYSHNDELLTIFIKMNDWGYVKTLEHYKQIMVEVLQWCGVTIDIKTIDNIILKNKFGL